MRTHIPLLGVFLLISLLNGCSQKSEDKKSVPVADAGPAIEASIVSRRSRTPIQNMAILDFAALSDQERLDAVTKYVRKCFTNEGCFKMICPNKRLTHFTDRERKLDALNKTIQYYYENKLPRSAISTREAAAANNISP